jgi:hypothetical protein
MSIDAHTGVITWVPSETQVGDHVVTVRLSDTKDQVERTF